MTAPVPRSAYLLFGAVILFWGLNWPIMKVGLTYIPPFAFGTARLILGAALLLVLNAVRGELELPARRDLPIVVSVGLLQMFLVIACNNLGLQVVGAGRAALLAYTTPLWVAPGARLWLGERLSAAKIAGILVGLGGLAMLFNPLAVAWEDARVLEGNGILLVGAVCWALSLLHVRGHRWQGTPLQLLPFQMLLAAPLLAVLSVVREADRPIRWGAALAAVLGYNAVVATAFCYWGAITVTRVLPASTTAVGFLGVPVVATLSSVLLVGEPATVSLLAGLATIVAGLALVARADVAARSAR